jgi:hypothetical protein
LLSAVAVVGVVAVGCGSDGADESSTVTTSSVSRAAYVKRVNAICARRKEERLAAIEAYAKENPSEDGASEEAVLDAVKAVFAPQLEEEADEIREVAAPRADRRQVEAILAGIERAADVAAGLESTEVKVLVDRAFLRASNLSSKYGLDECVIE